MLWLSALCLILILNSAERTMCVFNTYIHIALQCRSPAIDNAKMCIHLFHVPNLPIVRTKNHLLCSPAQFTILISISEVNNYKSTSGNRNLCTTGIYAVHYNMYIRYDTVGVNLCHAFNLRSAYIQDWKNIFNNVGTIYVEFNICTSSGVLVQTEKSNLYLCESRVGGCFTTQSARENTVLLQNNSR